MCDLILSSTEGGHPVYLDSPNEFVMEVLKFMEEKGL
jgi:hypothetical protein